MSRALVIQSWCDVCQRDDDAQVTGETFQGLLDGKPRELELCEAHWAQLVKPLADVMAELGRKPDGQAPKTGPGRPRKSPPMVQAQAEPSEPERPRKAPQKAQAQEQEQDHAYPCLLCDAVLVSQGSYRHHLNRHGLSAPVAQGDTCPVCGQEGLTKVGVHVSGQHADMGLANAAQALVWARDHNDPYGAYKAVMRAVGEALA